MQEYAQKSMSTTLPRNDFRSMGAPPGVLSHLVMPVMSGAVPQLSSSGAPLVQFDSCGVLVVDEAAEVELLAQLVLAADPLLQCAGVVGDRPLQYGGQVEHQRDGQQDRDDACDDADFALPAPERGDALGHPLPGQREEQQRQRGAHREGQRQRDGVEPDGSGCARDDDGGQHRARTRHVQHAQRQAETETALPGTELLLREPGERLLQQRLELREDQSEADGHQRDERHPADRVLGQMQQRQQRRTQQRDDAEAQHQSGDHAVGPQGFRQRAPGATLMATAPDPVGLRSGRPPWVPEKKITGSTGRMHGEMPVISPPRKPIAMSVVMSVLRSVGRSGRHCAAASLIGNEHTTEEAARHKPDRLVRNVL